MGNLAKVINETPFPGYRGYLDQSNNVTIAEALKEAGLQSPQEVAVMGYDDQEVAQHLAPALSTVLLPHLEMGRWAVEQLMLGARTPSKIKLECPVVMRHSI